MDVLYIDDVLVDDIRDDLIKMMVSLAVDLAYKIPVYYMMK